MYKKIICVYENKSLSKYSKCSFKNYLHKKQHFLLRIYGANKNIFKNKIKQSSNNQAFALGCSQSFEDNITLVFFLLI